MKNEIPIFFAVDDAYIPFLAVTIQSLSEHINEQYIYNLKVLYTNINESNQEEIAKYQNENIKIEFVDVNEKIQQMQKKLYTRDYYTNATYYRVLIPNLYPEYNKAIYLDSDIIILDDVAKLYNTNINKYLIAGVEERWLRKYNELQNYAKKVIGLKNYKKYINAGIMLMNLEELRNINFEEKFLHLLETTKYTFAQDQDYFNRMCKGRIKYLSYEWNVCGYLYKEGKAKILHYTIFKPWQENEMPNQEYFWSIAKKTTFYNDILDKYDKEKEQKESKGENSLLGFRKIAKYEADCVGNG